MKREDFWWLLWGISIAFGLQVLYDGIGEFPNYTQKFWGGLSLEAILCIALLLYGLYLFGGKKIQK